MLHKMQWINVVLVFFFAMSLLSTVSAFDVINMAEVDCGVTSNMAERLFANPHIIGGSTVDGPEEFPWIVAVKYAFDEKKPPSLSCGGSLIGKRWVLTAAHCFPPTNASNYEKRKAKFVFSFGEYDLRTTEERESEVQMIKAEKIFLHPSYGVKSGSIVNDIALVYLQKEVNWTQVVKPICLSSDKDLSFAGVIATAAGWGKQKESGKVSPTLQKVNLPIIYNKQCKQWFQDELGESTYIPNTVMCAGLMQGGRDTCQGDSGGPLMVPHWSGRFVLAGITSWGIGCAQPKLPGVYTRIASHMDWILATIAKQKLIENNQIIHRDYLLPPLFFRG